MSVNLIAFELPSLVILNSYIMKKFGGGEKCHVCAKTVYATEKISADEKVFHKSCLKCTHCNKVLSTGNYASMDSVYYCKPHFKQLFALKGNYDEGFGKEQHKTKWANKTSENGGTVSEEPISAQE